MIPSVCFRSVARELEVCRESLLSTLSFPIQHPRLLATLVARWLLSAVYSAMSRSRITKAKVERLVPGEVLWDSEVKGFGVRRQTTRTVYVLKARVKGRQRWITIGDHGAPWTAELARKEAQRIWGLIRSGADVTSLRAKPGQPVVMAELCARYLKEHADQHKKPSSRLSDERNIANHIIPLLGKRVVEDVTRADIDRFKLAVREGRTAKRGAKRSDTYRGGAVVTGGPGVANRCLALLSKMFNLAERWAIRPEHTNPVRFVEKYKEGKRERYLGSDEFDRLADVLEASERELTEGPYVLAAIRLLILTGARLGEILTLRWEYVDFQHRALRLPDSKTGRKVVFLSQSALAVLKQVPRVASNPHVIVGAKTGQPLRNLQKPWGRMRSAAGLEGVRIHDLRHSYASLAAAAGVSLPVIGRLLGHKKSTTTERYAHLAPDPMKLANEAIGDQLKGIVGASGESKL